MMFFQQSSVQWACSSGVETYHFIQLQKTQTYVEPLEFSATITQQRLFVVIQTKSLGDHGYNNLGHP